MNRNRIVLIAIAAVIVIVLAIFLLPKRGKTEQGAAGKPTQAGEAGGGGSLDRAEARAMTPDEVVLADGKTASKNMEETRDHYMEMAQYPPESRPATRTYSELYEWNTVGVEHDQAIGFKGDQEIFGHIMIDKHFTEPGRPLVVMAECYVKEGDQKIPVPFEATTEVHVGLTTEETALEPADVSAFMHGFKPVGPQVHMTKVAGKPHLKTTTIAVESYAKPGELHRDARVIVYLEPEDNDLRPLELNFQYSAKPPIKIIGLGGDEVVDGSLVLTVDVDLASAAPMRMRAAIAPVGKLDQPIAIYDDWYRPTTGGRHAIKMRFFGRILREAGIDGPYELFRLHGSAYVEGQPIPEIYWQEDRTFKTKAHKAEDFAMDKWESPEKDAALKNYAEAIESLRAHEKAQGLSN